MTDSVINNSVNMLCLSVGGMAFSQSDIARLYRSAIPCILGYHHLQYLIISCQSASLCLSLLACLSAILSAKIGLSASLPAIISLPLSVSHILIHLTPCRSCRRHSIGWRDIFDLLDR